MPDKLVNRSWLESVLVCPACLAPGIASRIEKIGTTVFHQCSHCRRIYPLDSSGAADFQVIDKILAIPEPYLGIWALAQLNSIEDYRARKAGSVALPELEIVKSFSRFMDLSGRIVLDIGSGLHNIPGYVTDRTIKHYVAIDPLSIERPAAFNRIQAWAECLPFADDTFDTVVFGTSLDHLVCLESALTELRRVLKDGGTVYLWGAWFPDERFYKNIPAKSLFPRAEGDILEDPAFIESDRRRREIFAAAVRDSGRLESEYSQFMVDKWHFRHLPLRFAKQLEQKYGFRVDTFDLREWNYHGNHIFLNGFVKLTNVIPASRRDENPAMSQLDSLSLQAGIADELLTLSLTTMPLLHEGKQAIGGLYQSIASISECLNSLANAQETARVSLDERLASLERAAQENVRRLDELHKSQDQNIAEIARRLEAQAETQKKNEQAVSSRLDRIEESAAQRDREILARRLGPRIARLARKALHFTFHPWRSFRAFRFRQKSRISGFIKFKFPIWIHGKLLGLTCEYLAPVWRRFVRPRKISGDGITVCHVTCSFDLGGTQRQIMNLCLNDHEPRLRHLTTEIFPEHNFLYRQDTVLEAYDYTGGGFVSRKLGRLVLNSDTRSLQLVQIYKLMKDFRRLKPDVVVGWGHEVAMLAFAAAAFVRVPKIAFCIRTWNPGLGWTTIPKLLYKSHRAILPLLDGVIVNSTLLQRDYAQWLNIRPGRISVCPNGIAPVSAGGAEERARIRARYGIQPDALVISNVGRFSGEKGQMILIRAFEMLQREMPGESIYCLLCGDGPLLDEAKDYAKAHGLDRIVFAGKTLDVDAHLRASDIYVMPSDFEGMPNAMMEAMAFGLPCVSTDRSGALDIARDGQEALYVGVGSAGGMKDKLVYLVQHPEERRRLGDNARRRLEEFSMDRMAANFDRILTWIADRKF